MERMSAAHTERGTLEVSPQPGFKVPRCFFLSAPPPSQPPDSPILKL